MLQNHENEDIYKLAYEIIDQFFSSDVSSSISYPLLGNVSQQIGCKAPNGFLTAWFSFRSD